MTPEQKLVEMGLTLPPVPPPLASYIPTRRHGGLVYMAGQGAIIDNVPLATGKFGAELTLEDAPRLALPSVLNALATLKRELGELSRIDAILALTGYVASTTDFHYQHLVVNPVSELLAEILGEAGRHSRVAIGTNVLPLNMPLEISMVVAVAD